MKFSVSMCVYGKDHAEWFSEALQSVWNQTVKPDEVVLVVDGPVPDAINSVIQQYESDERFQCIRLKENQGHGNARRIGLHACTNELVALMDADDICVPTRFEKQLAVFESDPELDIVGGNIAEFIDQPENVVGLREVPEQDVDIKQYMKSRCPMNQVTVMFKKTAVKKAGGYIDWYCEEDYYLWLRMAQCNMKFANIDALLVHVRVGKEMYQRRGGWAYFKSEAKLQKYMYERHFIGIPTYCMNVLKRLIVQVLLPNRLRSWVFKTFARKRSQ